MTPAIVNVLIKKKKWIVVLKCIAVKRKRVEGRISSMLLIRDEYDYELDEENFCNILGRINFEMGLLSNRPSTY